MKIIKGFKAAKSALSRQAPRELIGGDEQEQSVRDIINDVAQRGDAAILEYTRKFDGVTPKTWEVDREQIAKARNKIAPDLLEALNLAAKRIHSFHMRQRESLWSGDIEGMSWMVRPLHRVGIYAPRGTAPYPSSLLMTAIPAKVAGVKEVILATPPKKIPPVILAAADIAEVDRVFSIGGAQAIAAMALGTKTIPSVDKVCGPGSIYVTLAKKLLYGVVGIDGLYGPSEVLIIADNDANPAYCAADLLAQAEHGTLSAAILVTTSKGFASKVNHEVGQQIKKLPRREIALESLENNGLIAVVDSIDEAIELANLYAPEHVLLLVEDAKSCIDQLSNAGCIVIGKRATVAIGDYIAGPSHVLPTEGTARFSSPLNITDFIKLVNVVTVEQDNLEELGEAAATIARAEGFEAHAQAVERRLGKGHD
ncbi:MAG: histidinol dehydrogenase [Dehalococcoidales bacterium]|nr:MAG: histidinol dehydrogenase [Dehalococcoidales bacterium]